MAKEKKPKLQIPIRKYRGTTSVVSARLPKDLISAIDRVSKKTGYNRNEVLSMCLEFAVENIEVEGAKE